MTNITILSHYDTEDQERYGKILEASKIHPLYAMKDLSAIFIKDGRTDTVGTIRYVEDGNIRPVHTIVYEETIGSRGGATIE